MSELSCLLTSLMMSLTLVRFSLVEASLLSAASFLCLYLFIPAASSKITLLSSGLAETSQPTCPCSMMEYALVPTPVSVKRSTMSRRRHWTLLM